MYKLKPYVILADETVQENLFYVKTAEKNGVCAVYMEALSRNALNENFGGGIDFEIENIDKWAADFRHSEFWCMPAFGENLKDVPDETQGLIYRKKDGVFGVVLPVVSEKYKCVLKGNENGGVTAKLFSWYSRLNSINALAFLYAEGDNPYILMEKCAKTGLKLLGTGVRARDERRYPELFKYLGWCSWDSMEIRVSEDGIIEKCEEFKNKDIPVKWAIFDDMWAHIKDFHGKAYKNRSEMFSLMHSSKLYSFEADPIRFPGGLKTCIDKVKEYGITVGMWHPTTGYWNGIDPDGEVYEKYKDLLIQAPDGQYISDYKQDKAYLFYNAFHSFLRSCGAEFVKIDNQSMTRRFYKGLAPVGAAAREFHNAMEASAGQHFDNCMINCMGMASEDMWNRTVSPVSRCSDDFQPENKAWFTKHILQCAYNCLVQGQFYYCDWDMWWSDDGQAVKNSVLRAISGGPVYVSDKIGRSRRDILMPLVFDDGKILMCDRPAVPTEDCMFDNPVNSGKIFKLQNICGDGGVIAVFNLDEDEKQVCGTVSPSDIFGIKGEEFAVYEHFSKEVKILKRTENFNLTLSSADDFKLYVAVPVKNGFAPIGRTDKFISPKSIKAVHGEEIELVENGEYAFVKNGELFIAEK